LTTAAPRSKSASKASTSSKNTQRTAATAAGSSAATARPGGAGQAAAGSEAAADVQQVEIVPPNGELCDRQDNDDNGAVDDADVEKDGVCDCLKIASIGRPGTYGEGDLQFRTWPNAMAQNHVVSLGDAELNAERLAEIDVLIVLNVSTTTRINSETPHHAFSDPEVSAFERWVRAGGGVFTTSGYTGDLEQEVVNVNKLLAPFKLGYSPSKYGLDGVVSKWTSHPLTEGVSSVYTEVGAEPDGSEALTLATDTKQHVALQVPKSGAAKIVVWGDEWITYASQWRAKSDLQVERFWVNALTWLAREGSCQHAL
jgi:hypothetical protein